MFQSHQKASKSSLIAGKSSPSESHGLHRHDSAVPERLHLTLRLLQSVEHVDIGRGAGGGAQNIGLKEGTEE